MITLIRKEQDASRWQGCTCVTTHHVSTVRKIRAKNDAREAWKFSCFSRVIFRPYAAAISTRRLSGCSQICAYMLAHGRLSRFSDKREIIHAAHTGQKQEGNNHIKSLCLSICACFLVSPALPFSFSLSPFHSQTPRPRHTYCHALFHVV
jgi:hypothetical protein